MIKCKYIKLGWLLLFFFYFSCTNRQPPSPVTTVHFNNLGEEGVQYTINYPNNGVQREVPELYRNNVLYRERKKVESALKIGGLENGFNGQQFGSTVVSTRNTPTAGIDFWYSLIKVTGLVNSIIFAMPYRTALSGRLILCNTKNIHCRVPGAVGPPLWTRQPGMDCLRCPIAPTCLAMVKICIQMNFLIM